MAPLIDGRLILIAGRGDPWKNAFAFLLLASATLVVVLILRLTFLLYPSFDPWGRVVAWLVGIGSFLALFSLGVMVVRLYISPILPPNRRKKSPPVRRGSQ